ncbi:MAG: hypothetical protein HQ574_08885 [Chloroflexi bacterium]|nr:hypothetical protein [Chloroflexota bacterium]
MFEIRKPRLGLAGVMCTPFRGDKEGNYSGDIQDLEKLAAEYDFEFHSLTEGIYNLDQAQAAAMELEEWGADFIILQTSSFASGDFIYPFTKLTAKLGLWAVPEGPPTSEGGLPLNSFTASNLYNSIIRTTLTDYQKPVKWFFGHPGQPLFDQRLKISVQALRALANLPGKKIALIGGVAPSFDNLIIDYQKPKDRLGIEVVEFELEQVLQIARALDKSQLDQTLKEISSSAKSIQGGDSAALEKTARTYLAIQTLAKEQQLEAVALSCWPQFQADYGLAVCSVMGHLNSQGLIASCEGDLTSAISMLALRYLTNGEIVTLMDLVTIDPSDESVLLWHCGPTSPSLADKNGATMRPLWLFDNPEKEQTGFHNDLVLKPGPGTVFGFSTDFESMLLMEGEIDNKKPSYRGSRGWFKNLQLDGESIPTSDLIQTLMVSGYQHHYPFAYGNLANAGLEICSWLGIAPISRVEYTPYLR